MPTTIAGLFDERAGAERAVQELISAGVPNDKISVVAADPAGELAQVTYSSGTYGAEGVATGLGSGAVVGGLIGLVVGAGLLAIPAIGLVAAGPIAGMLAGAGIGAAAGGILGGLIGLGIPHAHAEVYAEGLRRGGTLVTASVTEPLLVRCEQILRDFGAVDMNVRADYYRQNGWTAYDSSLPPYTAAEIEAERIALSSRGAAVAPAAPMVASAYPTGQITQPVDVVPDPVMETVVSRGPLPDVEVVEPVAVVAPVATPVVETVAPVESVVQVVPVGSLDGVFEGDFMTRFGPQAGEYAQYAPAYRWGYELAVSPLYQRSEWYSVEPNIKFEWERNNPGTWDVFREAIHFAWDKARVRTGGATVI